MPKSKATPRFAYGVGASASAAPPYGVDALLDQTWAMQEVQGNLLQHDADVLVQQCNCVTRRPLGLSAAIAAQLGVNPYAERSGAGSVADAASSVVPGTISLHAVPNDPSGRRVACLYAQYAPGSARKIYPVYERVKQERGIQETPQLREQWFAACLAALAVELDRLALRRVALPHGIGCGLAGGAWPRYRAMIEAWAAQHPRLQVTVVKI